MMLPPSRIPLKGFSISQSSLLECTYVASNMREYDRAEIMCQLPDDSPQSHAGLFAWEMSKPNAWTAKIDGQPVAVFGVTPVTLSQNVQQLWMFGTDQLLAILPFAGLFVVNVLLPTMKERGLTRIEVRAMYEHDETHAWMKNLGAHTVGPLGGFGKNGERFIMYAWEWDCMTERVVKRYQALQKRFPIVRDGDVWYFSRSSDMAVENTDVLRQAS